jgi:hypothetical protein
MTPPPDAAARFAAAAKFLFWVTAVCVAVRWFLRNAPAP